MARKRKIWIAISIASIILISYFTYSSLNQKNTKESITVKLNSSPDFSKNELNQGVDEVIRSFNNTWKDSILHSIYFDEASYQLEMTNREPDTSLFSNLEKNNVLIFQTSFTTGKKVEGSIGPNSQVDGWRFILTRKNKNSPWKYLDQGV